MGSHWGMGFTRTKHGHDGNLQEAYKRQRPCLVGWARAAFEQGSLPALLALPGAVETKSVARRLHVPSNTHPDGLHETGHRAWLWGGQS